MNTLEQDELTALNRHIERFPKSPIYNSEVTDTAGRKTRRRRTQAIAKRYAFHANAMKHFFLFCVIPVIYKLIRTLPFVLVSTITNFNNFYVCLQFSNQF